MRTDSAAIPTGKLARNIVAGALNRKEVDSALFKEIRFVAYSLESPQMSPEEGYRFLRTAGFETARAAVIPAADLTATKLSQIFTTAETKSPYQLDGIVIAPNMARPATYTPELRGGAAVNPGDRVAWKTRLTAETARTTVREVEWNVSYQGFLIPRVLFDTVTLAGANISAATGLHGRWIFENGVGPGAEIEVRRAGDVIPQIIAVHTKVTPAMPAEFAWASKSGVTTAPAAEEIHIKPAGNQEEATGCIRLIHALGELGVENVGPGLVAKLYAAGLTTLKQIYTATVKDLAKVDGIKEKGAERLWQGLRAKQQSWTELNFLVASATMPRGVSHSKLAPLLALNPNPASWTAAALKAKRPTGLSESTIDAIVEAIPAYLAWKAATGLNPSVQGAPAPSNHLLVGPQSTIVFTGVRDKAFEEQLLAKGHIIADTVTKKTTHVVYAGSTISTKIIKAQELGVTLLTLSEAKTIL
jgi:DNA ligase (NAD+)